MTATWDYEPVTILEPHGFIGLEKHCADDLDVVNAAKASFARYADSMGPAECSLIKFLMSNHHTSPFEHTFFKFHVRCPITVAREWVRHRIGIAWNEESGRYVELRPDCYVPAAENVRTQAGKPGSYRFEPIKETILVETIQENMRWSYEFAYDTYQRLLGMGVAKELARNVLPVGMFTEYLWSCNAHSLMHFLTLRNDPTAMREIRMYAAQMEDWFCDLMPVTGTWYRNTLEASRAR